MAITFRGATSSFRTLGSAATPHNLFTMENTAGSAVVVYVKKLLVLLDATAVLTSVMPQIKLSRAAALASNGTALVKGSLDSSLSSAANVILRGATASDGGGASAITATAGDTIWQQYVMRLHTAVGQVLVPDFNLLPLGCELTAGALLLRANECIVVQLVATAGGSNPNTNHWIVQAQWDEDTP
jgi:hypothetical protein